MKLVIGVSASPMIGHALRPLMLTSKTSVSGLVIFRLLIDGRVAVGFAGPAIAPIILVATARLLEDLRHADLL